MRQILGQPILTPNKPAPQHKQIRVIILNLNSLLTITTQFASQESRPDAWPGASYAPWASSRCSWGRRRLLSTRNPRPPQVSARRSFFPLLNAAACRPKILPMYNARPSHLLYISKQYKLELKLHTKQSFKLNFTAIKAFHACSSTPL